MFLVNREFLADLIRKCIAKAGTLHGFCRATGLTSPSVYHFLKGQVNLISIRKLKLILDYVGLPYSVADTQIVEIRKGKTASVVSPRFPIDLNIPDMGTLLGHVVSDGSIYVDTQRNQLRTKYTNSDAELTGHFLDSANRVFGKIHHTTELTRGAVTVRFGAEIVGNVLAEAGAMVGNKTKQNGKLPWIVREGSEAIKIAYLRAAFSDEGSVGASRGYPYVILSRSCTVPIWVSNRFAGRFDDSMHSSLFPTGHLHKTMSLRRAINLAKSQGFYSPEIAKTFEKPPQLLSQEKELLDSLNIRANLSPATFSKNHSGSYSFSYALSIQGRANVTKFYKKVGFSLCRKQEKLRIFLEKRRWI